MARLTGILFSLTVKRQASRLRRWCQLLGATFALTIGCVGQPAESSALPSENQRQSSSASSGAVTPGSGIYGYTVAAWGNAPANPPTTQCLKVFDSKGTHLIATGTCSGHFGNFRVPLVPGRYVVETGGSWQSKNGAVIFVPIRKIVEVRMGHWVKLAPPQPPGPVP
jgi:hypothetical protein